MPGQRRQPLVADGDGAEGRERLLVLLIASLLDDHGNVGATPLRYHCQSDSPEPLTVGIALPIDLAVRHVLDETRMRLDLIPDILDGELVGRHGELQVLDLVCS